MKKILFAVFSIFIFFNGRQVDDKKNLVAMVYVEHGSFLMGSDAGHNDEKPVHKVNVTKSFYISKFELTCAQGVKLLNWAYSKHKVFVGNNTTRDGARWVKTKDNNEPKNYARKYGILKIDSAGVKIDFKDGKFFVHKGCDNYPLMGINWVGAVTLCNLLSEMEGLEPVYNIAEFLDGFYCDFTKNGYRLPTEAEWEFAAKGGIKSKGYLYSGSDNPDDVAWYRENSGWALHPVGLKKPNELGIYDMSGNAAEICFDVYNSKYYSISVVDDPKGADNYTVKGGNADLEPDTGEYHLRRGGFYMSKTDEIRSSERIWGVYYCPELCTVRFVRNNL